MTQVYVIILFDILVPFSTVVAGQIVITFSMMQNIGYKIKPLDQLLHTAL